MTQFCAVRFSRGMGFGNRLFPWARCHLYSVRNGVPMLAPHWWWPPRMGPLFKAPAPLGELRGHLYVHGLRQLHEYVGGVRRTLIMATSRKNVRFFQGEAARFNDLGDAHDVLHDALHRICTIAVPRFDEPHIGAHMRRGDFGEATAEELQTRGGVRTPTSWFLTTLRAIRAEIGYAVPLRVVSDADANELSELLDEPKVSLVRTGAPLGDMLTLANAQVLLASGSSFSAWACYLGGMPTASHPGQSLRWYGLEPRAFVGEYDPSQPDRAFVQAAVNGLSRA